LFPADFGVIAGVVTGSSYVLAEYFQPEPKQISKALRNVKAGLMTPRPLLLALMLAPLLLSNLIRRGRRRRAQ
jgi:hypothetical protein